ncbi:MAG: 6-bladed beta-propeller [Bacteroidaceae bacterium]|nr:6-bladed beta-propeller [Bacteroidaceae bacterium]
MLLSVLLVGCGQTMKDEFMALDMGKSYPEKQLVLQDFMEVEYVALETSDEFLTRGHVGDVGREYVVTNDYDEGDIFLFDRHTGRGVRKINHLGQGPGEYSQVLGLVLDEKSNELFVNDPGSKKIHVYDLEGVFKRSLDYPEGKQFFDVLDFDEDHLIAYNVEGLFDDGAERGDKTFHTLFSKHDGSITEDIYIPFDNINAPVVNQDGMYAISILNTIDRYKDGMLISDTSSDTIYFYSQAKTLEPFMAKAPNTGTDYFVTMGAMTDRYSFIQITKKEFSGRGFPTSALMYDKQEQALYDPIVKNADFIDGEKVNMLYNPINKKEVTALVLYEAGDLVEALENDELSGPLKEVAAKLTDDDNPVIMLMKEK